MSQSTYSVKTIHLQKILHLLLAVQILLFCVLTPTQGEARDQEEEAKSFIESIASIVYTAAWPTATYKDIAIKSIEPIDEGFNVSVKLSGKSCYGSNLWLVIILKISNGTLKGISVVDHNAPIVPPFATAGAISELITKIVEQAEHSNGYRFFVKNSCRHAIKLALKYKKMNGDWLTDGWWEIGGYSSGYLSDKGAYVKTKSSIAYYYAETKNGKYHWGDGTIYISFGDIRLPMTKVDDRKGDTEITLACPGE